MKLKCPKNLRKFKLTGLGTMNPEKRFHSE